MKISEEQLLFWKKAMFPEIEEKDKEIERLNNIINELEKWLNERKVVYNITREDRDIDYTIIEVLEKLQELKGENSEFR